MSGKYDQAFFLNLAAQGKDAWNTWRRNPANKDAYVTFKGVDFSVAPRDGIDFSGFEFGDWPDFSQCKWGGGDWDRVRGAYPDVFKLGCACFTDASFGHSASFEGAAFGDFASFTGALPAQLLSATEPVSKARSWASGRDLAP